jgi:hypothetical protein
MIDLADASLVVGSFLSLYGLHLAIKRTRRDHPDHVRALWYIFFLTLCIVLPYYLYYYFSGELMRDILSHGPRSTVQEIRQFIFDTLTDPVGDIIFALAIIYIAIVPQILSLLFSGALFGCGSRPILALEITKFAILGLIKSFCCLSAILVAIMLLQLCISSGFFGDNNLYGHSLGPTLFQAAIYLVVTFGMLLIYLRLDGLWLYMQKTLPPFQVAANFLTRHNRRPETPSSPHDVELLLRPIIGHILGDIEVKEVASFILERRLRGRAETVNQTSRAIDSRDAVAARRIG